MATQIKHYLKRFESRFGKAPRVHGVVDGQPLSLTLVANQVAHHFQVLPKNQFELVESILNGSKYDKILPSDSENNSLQTLLLQVTAITAVTTITDFDSGLMLFVLLQEAGQSYIQNNKAYAHDAAIQLLEPYLSFEKAKAVIKNNLIAYLVKRGPESPVQGEAENGRKFLVDLVPFVLKIIADQATHLTDIHAQLRKLNQMKKTKKNRNLSTFMDEHGLQIKQIEARLNSIVIPESLITHLPELFYNLRYMGLSNSSHFYIDQIHRLYYQHAHALENLSHLRREVNLSNDHVNVPKRVDQLMDYLSYQVNRNLDGLRHSQAELIRDYVMVEAEQKLDVAAPPLSLSSRPAVLVSKLLKRVDWLLPKIPRFLINIVFTVFSVFNKVFAKLIDIIRPRKLLVNSVDTLPVLPPEVEQIDIVIPLAQDDSHKIQDQIEGLVSIQGLIANIKKGLVAFDTKSVRENKVTQNEINQLLQALQNTPHVGVEASALNQLYKINQQFQSGLSFTHVKLSPEDRHFINDLMRQIEVPEEKVQAPQSLGAAAMFKFEFERLFKSFFEAAIVANSDMMQLNMDENNAQKALSLLGKIVGQMPFGAGLLEVLVSEANDQVKAKRLAKFKNALSEIALHLQKDDLPEIMSEVSLAILNVYQDEIGVLSVEDAKKAAKFFLLRFQNKLFNLKSSESYIETMEYDSVRVDGWAEKLKNQLMRYVPDGDASQSVSLYHKHVISAYRVEVGSSKEAMVRVGLTSKPLSKHFSFKKWHEVALCKEVSLIFYHERGEHKENETAYLAYIKHVLEVKYDAPWIKHLSPEFYRDLDAGYFAKEAGDLTSKIIRIRNHLALALQKTLVSKDVYQEFYEQNKLLLELPRPVTPKKAVPTLTLAEEQLWGAIERQGMLSDFMKAIALEDPRSLTVMSVDKKLSGYQKNQLKQLKELLEHENCLGPFDKKFIQLLRMQIPALSVDYLSVCLKATHNDDERRDKVSRRNLLANAFAHILAIGQKRLAPSPRASAPSQSLSSSRHALYSPVGRVYAAKPSIVTTQKHESSASSLSLGS